MLIVEDGTIVENANSYVDIEFVRTFATNRGEKLPEDDVVLSTLIFNAMDYVEVKEDTFQGKRTDVNQELSFPRIGIVVRDSEINSTTIPIQIKNAVAQLCIDQANGNSLTPNKTQFAIKRRRVETLTTEYAVGKDGKPLVPEFIKANNFIKPLLRVVHGTGTYR